MTIRSFLVNFNFKVKDCSNRKKPKLLIVIVGQGVKGVIKNNKPKNIMKIGKRYEGDKITKSLSR